MCEAQARLLTSAVLLRGSCAGPGDEFKINEQILAVSPPNNGPRRTDIPSTRPAGSS